MGRKERKGRDVFRKEADRGKNRGETRRGERWRIKKEAEQHGLGLLAGKRDLFYADNF